MLSTCQKSDREGRLSQHRRKGRSPIKSTYVSMRSWKWYHFNSSTELNEPSISRKIRDSSTYVTKVCPAHTLLPSLPSSETSSPSAMISGSDGLASSENKSMTPAPRIIGSACSSAWLYMLLNDTNTDRMHMGRPKHFNFVQLDFGVYWGTREASRGMWAHFSWR